MDFYVILIIKMVGKTGFEPATPWSQTKCSTKLSHFPIYGALEGIRTPDLLVRSQTLYPTELRAHDRNYFSQVITNIYGGSSGNRTSDTGIFSPLLYQLSYEAKNNGGLNGTRTRDLLRDRQTC